MGAAVVRPLGEDVGGGDVDPSRRRLRRIPSFAVAQPQQRAHEASPGVNRRRLWLGVLVGSLVLSLHANAAVVVDAARIGATTATVARTKSVWPCRAFMSGREWTLTRTRTCHGIKALASPSKVEWTVLFSQNNNNKDDTKRLRLVSPLLERGYPPTVAEAEEGAESPQRQKPLMVYFPGFDGTLVAPFLQFPELSTILDVWGMEIPTSNRMSVPELRDAMISKILQRVQALQQTQQEEEEEKTKAEERVQNLKKKDTSNENKNNNNADDEDELEDVVSSNLRWEHKEMMMKASEAGQQPNLMASIGNWFQLGRRREPSSSPSPAPPPSPKPKTTITKTEKQPIYLVGESFGAIMALEVLLALSTEMRYNSLDVAGVVLINSATCFDRSRLASLGPPIVEESPPCYWYKLITTLLPLFADAYSWESLLQILSGQALPSIIDTPEREAYMGRTAAALPRILPVMDAATLQFRLSEWLQVGCQRMVASTKRLKGLRKAPPLLIVAGQDDVALPSIAEARRLLSLFPQNASVHVVEGAGHASTCGNRLDLAAVMRHKFPALRNKSDNGGQRGANVQERNDELSSADSGRLAMKAVAARGQGASFGMEPRYDGKTIGISPLLYWSPQLYREPAPSTIVEY